MMMVSSRVTGLISFSSVPANLLTDLSSYLPGPSNLVKEPSNLLIEATSFLAGCFGPLAVWWGRCR